MSSRTMKIVYRGVTIMIRESHNGQLEMVTGPHRVTPDAKTFKGATNEARLWLLAHAGEMRGDKDGSYERK